MTKVLLIDDDPALLRMIRLIMLTDGFEVATAQDGLEGLDKARQDSFDVIVLDMQMPRMDGRSFFRQMRANGDCTPVVVLSAYNASDARNELQAEAALNKPFDPNALLATVHSLIDDAPDRQLTRSSV